MKAVRGSFESYELNRAAKALRNFIVEDLSRFYMKIAKDRISSGENAAGSLWTIYHVMLSSIRMLGVLSPMLSEHLYQKFFRKHEKDESIFLLPPPEIDDGDIDALAEKQMETVKEVVSTAMLLRQSANIKVRWPIRTLYVETKSHEATDAVKAFEDIILSLVNAKGLETVEEKPHGEIESQEFMKGMIHMDKKIDEELYEEGMLNEIKRRVQMMRKEAEFVEQDRIKLTISTEKEIEGILKKQEKGLVKQVNADELSYAVDKTMKEFKIDGRLVKISIKKV
jgi:isoleucyl-tRNA synthetase